MERAQQAGVPAWLASTPDGCRRGLEADFSIAGRRPVFVAIARTTGPDRHTDVSRWYLLAGCPALPIALT